MSEATIDPAGVLGDSAQDEAADFGAWSLAGNTLIQSEKSVTQCISFQPTTTLGPC